MTSARSSRPHRCAGSLNLRLFANLMPLRFRGDDGGCPPTYLCSVRPVGGCAAHGVRPMISDHVRAGPSTARIGARAPGPLSAACHPRIKRNNPVSGTTTGRGNAMFSSKIKIIGLVLALALSACAQPTPVLPPPPTALPAPTPEGPVVRPSTGIQSNPSTGGPVVRRRLGARARCPRSSSTVSRMSSPHQAQQPGQWYNDRTR